MSIIEPRPLAIIPVYLSSEGDPEVLETTVRTLYGTTFNSVEILLVDDCSPLEDTPNILEEMAAKYGAEVYLCEENAGFSSTVNVGLQRALDEERHAILVNADLEFREPGWMERMAFQPNLNGDGYAYVVGALLSFPNGLIQHGGVYFSLLSRGFDHLWKYSPENLKEALIYRTAPVTGALQFIRHECLVDVGLYDERYKMAFEDVQYCIRVFQAGHECVFNPEVRAYHHESFFRGRPNPKVEQWTYESLLLLMQDMKDVSFAGLVPAW